MLSFWLFLYKPPPSPLNLASMSLAPHFCQILGKDFPDDWKQSSVWHHCFPTPTCPYRDYCVCNTVCICVRIICFLPLQLKLYNTDFLFAQVSRTILALSRCPKKYWPERVSWKMYLTLSSACHSLWFRPAPYQEPLHPQSSLETTMFAIPTDSEESQVRYGPGTCAVMKSWWTKPMEVILSGLCPNRQTNMLPEKCC